MPTTVHAIWLAAEGCSMRGVRYRQLSATEADDVEATAAADVEPTTTLAIYQRMINDLGARRMLVSVTEPIEPKEGVDPLDDEKLAWTPIDPTVIEVGFGEQFTAKDIVLLRRLYSRLHDISGGELNAILGKQKTVRSA